MSLDIETALCLGPCCQRRKKYDRRVFQFRVSVDSCCNFASVRFWHHDIEPAQIWQEIHGAPMGHGSVVLFEPQIVTGPVEKDRYQVRSIAVVIRKQGARYSFRT